MIYALAAIGAVTAIRIGIATCRLAYDFTVPAGPWLGIRQ